MADSTTFIEPFVDPDLGNSAYLVGSTAAGTAALIDPLRDVERYLAAAARLGVRLTHVLETHLHADFVSGAREIAARAGATIGASGEAGLAFDHQPLAEGDRLPLGDLELRVLATPGHTPEHISFLLEAPGAARPQALFSGGALIVGGAARTDLLGQELSEPLARRLYHTLQNKLMALPDEVSVYPTHGAGSYCVAPVSAERTTTIGRERAGNPLARAAGQADFVGLALKGLPSYPVYYHYLRAVNQRGPALLEGASGLKPLAPEAARALVEGGAVVLDVRPVPAFASGHIPGSFGIPVDTPLVTWAGWLIPFGARLILVADRQAQLASAVRQLHRIGYDDLAGHLEGGVEAWARAGLPVIQVPRLPVGELRERLGSGDDLTVLDVRQDSEWAEARIPGARHIEAGRLPPRAGDLPLPADRPLAVHCAHGARSTAAVSVLLRRGYNRLLWVEGGISAWMDAGFEVERGG